MKHVLLGLSLLFSVSYAQADIFKAVDQNNLEELEKALSDGEDVNTRDARGNTPLHLAIKRGDFKIIRALLEANADVDAQNTLKAQTPLMLALKYNQLAIAQNLLDRRAQIDLRNRQGSTALLYAVYYRHYRIVERLIDKGADLDAVNRRGFNALKSVIKAQDRSIALLLLYSGASIDSEDADLISNLEILIGENPETFAYRINYDFDESEFKVRSQKI